MTQGEASFPEATRKALRAVAGSLGWQIEHRDSVDSTMSEARRLIGRGASAQSVVVADEQRAGRGRRERTFVSPRGGLYLTAIVAAPPRIEEAWRLSFAGALAAARALRVFGCENLRFEWPNDLFEGANKVGGVLAELLAGSLLPTSAGGPLVLLGIGLNTGPDPSSFDPAQAGPAGPLRPGLAPRRPELCARLLFELDRVVAQCADPMGWRDVLQSVRSLSALRGDEPVRIRRHDGSELSGVAWELHEDGSLELRDDEGGARLVRYGEVVRT